MLIGGDFNTNTLDRSNHERPDLIRAALEADPERLVRPMRYEPMFAELSRRGYDWERCNVMGALTQRTPRRHARRAARPDRLVLRPRPLVQ